MERKEVNAATHYIDGSLTDAVGTIGLCDGTADHYDVASRTCIAGVGTKGFSTFEWAVESTRISQGDTVYVRGILNDTASSSSAGTLYATINIGNPTSGDYVVFESYDANSNGQVDADERAELRLNSGLNLRYFNSGATDSKLKFNSIDFTNPSGSTDYLFRLNVSTTTLYFDDCVFSGVNVSATTSTIQQLTAANVNLTVDRSEINDVGTFFEKHASSNGNVNFTLSRSFANDNKRLFSTIAESPVDGIVGTINLNLFFNDIMRPETSQVLLTYADTTLNAYNNRIVNGPDFISTTYTANVFQLSEVVQECFAGGTCPISVKGNNFWSEFVNWDTDTLDNFFSQEYNYVWDYIDYSENFFVDPKWDFSGGDYSYGADSYGNCRGYDDDTLNLFVTYPTDKEGNAWSCTSGNDVGALSNSRTAALALPASIPGRLCAVGDSISYYLSGQGSDEDYLQSAVGLDPFGDSGPEHPSLGGLSLMGGPLMAWYNLTESQCDVVMLSLIVNDLSPDRPANATYQKYADTILDLLDFYDQQANRVIWTGTPPEYDGGADPAAHTVDSDAVQDLVEVGCASHGFLCGSWLDYIRTQRPSDWGSYYYDNLLVTGDVHPNAAYGYPIIAQYYDSLYDPTVTITSASQSQDESVGTTTITVQLSAISGLDITIPFTTSGTAVASSTDYGITTSPIVITAGQTSATVTFTIIEDSLDEDSETAIVTLGTPTNGVLGSNFTHVLTITDNDATPTVTFSSGSASNGSEATVAASLNVALSVVSGRTITVNYSTLADTATTDVDYTAVSTSLTFNPGEVSKSITITVNNDTLDENDETLSVNLSDFSNVTAGANVSMVYTIIDNDDPSIVSWASAGQSSVDESGTVTITAQLNTASSFNVIVPYAVDAASTASGSDYSLITSSATIAAGATSAIVTLTVANDLLDENNETVIVNMGVPTNGTQGTYIVHTVTITDDDSAPSVSWTESSQSIIEEEVVITLTAELDAVSSLDATIPYVITGTATGNGIDIDYSISPASSVTIPAGSTSASISITVIEDTLVEPDETIVVTITDPTNAINGASSIHTATIIRDDDSHNDISSAPPVVSTTPIVTLTDLTDKTGGDTATVYWTTSGSGIDTVALYYSIDDGATYNQIAYNLNKRDGNFDWTVPNVDSDTVLVKIIAYDSGKGDLDTDVSAVFAISPVSEVISDPLIPVDEVTTTDSEGRTVGVDSGTVGPSPVTGEDESISTVVAGQFIRSYSFSTVYYVDEHFVRHPFWDTNSFFTYADSFGDVVWVTDATLPTMTMGDPILPKVGVVLVKIQSDTNVYAIDTGNVLRLVSSEDMAIRLYTADWADYVIDLEPTVFGRFAFGSEMTSSSAVDRSILRTRIALAELAR